jgi:hypothetical protein
LETQLKQNHNIWNKTKAKSQYLEHSSSKITIFGAKPKQNHNVWNTTEAKLQYLEHNAITNAIFGIQHTQHHNTFSKSQRKTIENCKPYGQTKS